MSNMIDKLDKYYTPSELAEYVVSKTEEIIGEQNITEYIEPSAGAGVFLDYLEYLDKPYLAYDIEPEDSRVMEQDYLELELEYKRGRCVIGNPPFGRGNSLSVKFYKKSIKLADYIAFIQPISQLDNNMQMYEFDLVHSEDLGKQIYTDREVHCCFNIYARPKNGELNKKNSYKLEDVEINEVRLGNKDIKNYDFRICAWGNVGKEVEYPNQYAKEFCIKILNTTYKNKIIELIKNANWCELYPMTTTPNLPQWQVYKYLKEQIPELE